MFTKTFNTAQFSLLLTYFCITKTHMYVLFLIFEYNFCQACLSWAWHSCHNISLFGVCVLKGQLSELVFNILLRLLKYNFFISWLADSTCCPLNFSDFLFENLTILSSPGMNVKEKSCFFLLLLVLHS